MFLSVFWPRSRSRDNQRVTLVRPGNRSAFFVVHFEIKQYAREKCADDSQEEKQAPAIQDIPGFKPEYIKFGSVGQHTVEVGSGSQRVKSPSGGGKVRGFFHDALEIKQASAQKKLGDQDDRDDGHDGIDVADQHSDQESEHVGAHCDEKECQEEINASVS